MNDIERFYRDLDFFRRATYTKKIEFMKKFWGNIQSDTVIHYTKNHTVSITIDSGNKYIFDFNINEIKFDEVEKYLPQHAKIIASGAVDELKGYDKHLADVSYAEIAEDVSTNQTEELENLPEVKDVMPEYTNIYNNINIRETK